MKTSKTYRKVVGPAVAATLVAMVSGRSAFGQNTPAVFSSGTNLLTAADYTPATLPGATSDLEFGAAYPSTAALIAIMSGNTSNLAVGTINDLNTSYAVTMSNNASTGNVLTLGSTSAPANSVSSNSGDLVYVAAGATLNIANNSSTGLTSVVLGSGNLDIAGTCSIQGIISGTSGLTKTGSGTLILYQADTYTGSSTVNANISSGTVQIGTGTALGSATGDVTFIGAATLYCYDNVIPSYASTFSSGRSFNISSATSTIKIGGTEAWTIDGAITGTGVLNVAAGTGSLTDNYTTSSAQVYGGGAGNASTNIISGTYILDNLLDLPQGICTINSGATFEEANTGGQYSSKTTFALGGGNDTIYVATINAQLKLFGTVSGTGNLVKTGTSTLVLENSNTYTGATNVASGSTLSLDYTSSLLSTALSLGGSTGGATFNLLSSSSGTFQTSVTTIAGTTLVGGGNTINVGAFNASTNLLSLGTITRTGATSTLNVILPSVGSVTTTATAANFSGGQQTIIGGFLTVNGSSWGVNNAGTLSPLTSYNTSFGSGIDADVTTSVSPSAASVNSIRFNTPSAVTVTLANPLTVATGGILETPNVGANAATITGSTITTGNGSDLIVSQFNPTGPLTINSQITGAVALTTTGVGAVVLNNASNSYAGGTFINGGILGVTSDTVLGPVPASPASNISFMGPGATLQADAASVTISANRNISLGAYGGTFDANSNALTLSGNISGGSLVYIANSTAGAAGLVTLASTATLTTSAVLVMGNAQSGGNFNLASGRSAAFNVASTSLAAGGSLIEAGAFTGAFNFSLGAISRTVGSTVNFVLPTTGTITTTTVNALYGQGQQTILGGYATVNGNTWAVSGSAATAGAISGLTSYDTGFDNNSDVDVTTGDAGSATNASYINSLRFNLPASLTVTLGTPTQIVTGENNISLYIATGGILETSAVGANTNYISGGVLSSDDKTDLVVIQNNPAAPLVISSTITNWNTSGVNLAFTKAGPGTVVLSGTNSYTGNTFVTGGTLQLASAQALPTGANLSISALSTVAATNTGTGAYAIAINALTNNGVLDLGVNAADIHTGSLAALTAQVAAGFNKGAWNGASGIESSAAAADTSHITAIGVIVNDGNGTGTPLYGANGSIGATFEGVAPADGDLLLKYTYYGDTNLDGKVDGSDYTRIDAAFLNNQNASNASLTGWFNGDFNYDGVVDGSDYTLIDNAFNTQTAVFASQIATSTAQFGGAGSASVPEPASLGILGLGLAGLLRRRRRSN